MKIWELAQQCGWELLCGDSQEETEVTGCYIGDLLSWVMARASSGKVWLTVMGNVNAVAVASLTDVACIVLTEGAGLDEEAAVKAKQQGILIYSCQAPTYETAVQICRLLGDV